VSQIRLIIKFSLKNLILKILMWYDKLANKH